MFHIQKHEIKPGYKIELSTFLEKPSPIHFGYKVEPIFTEELNKYDYDRVFFMTDEPIDKIYGNNFLAQIKKDIKGECIKITVPSGEQSKKFNVLESLCNDLINKGASKRSILIAFGGGGVGNLVGLAAGLIYRGIRYIEVPTTFTGQTDSTLSNKQAVNGKHGKNHFGLYHEPLFIWSDTNYLATEPKFSARSGIVEGIKNGFISEGHFLDYLDEVLNPKLEFSENVLFDLALNIILSKLEIIKVDPSEKGYGLILEYGHTFGHAIEWLEKGALPHGEAVAIGMQIAANLAKEMGLINNEIVSKHEYFIQDKLGYFPEKPASVTMASIMETMQRDNKKTGKNLRYVLLESIGKCHNPEGDFLVSVDDQIVQKVLKVFLNKWENLPSKLNASDSKAS